VKRSSSRNPAVCYGNTRFRRCITQRCSIPRQSFIPPYIQRRAITSPSRYTQTQRHHNPFFLTYLRIPKPRKPPQIIAALRFGLNTLLISYTRIPPYQPGHPNHRGPSSFSLRLQSPLKELSLPALHRTARKMYRWHALVIGQRQTIFDIGF
jgi:hypothetical protein